ncbi:unnamed protein product [Rotaria sordida]|uniref:Tc1-like transposase DDE domain-containing protein n=1 Tax=Rotaria sordida TaxID=392033 RepID=A0A820AA05_9BILA|nr:unnamed protein product [Rotaria sordida]
MYPTVENLLSTLLSQYPEFPIQSITSLRREMKALVQRTIYFIKIDQLRSNNSILYYHDETWLSKNQGKGQRLAINALLSLNCFHLRSLDIFKCAEVHSMDTNHFVAWMDSTASTLRSEHSKTTKIAIIIDNDKWHNKLTPESEPSKRA